LSYIIQEVLLCHWLKPLKTFVKMPMSRIPVLRSVQQCARLTGIFFCGVNVENVAYPEGTCAEAGAIAAMVAAGQTEIAEVYVIADSPDPVPPCGGCRQKLAEFAQGTVKVTMATLGGQEKTVTVADLLPGAFGKGHMDLG
jgi:cytidine deaminase